MINTGGIVMMSNVGDRIRELRIQKNLSQDRLALLINNRFNSNINKGMISKWENNREMPSSENMYMLTEVLECSLTYIMGFDEDVERIESAAELDKYFKENRKKLSSLSREDSIKLIKLIDLYLD